MGLITNWTTIWKVFWKQMVFEEHPLNNILVGSSIYMHICFKYTYETWKSKVAFLQRKKYQVSLELYSRNIFVSNKKSCICYLCIYLFVNIFLSFQFNIVTAENKNTIKYYPHTYIYAYKNVRLILYGHSWKFHLHWWCSRLKPKPIFEWWSYSFFWSDSQDVDFKTILIFSENLTINIFSYAILMTTEYTTVRLINIKCHFNPGCWLDQIKVIPHGDSLHTCWSLVFLLFVLRIYMNTPVVVMVVDFQ